MDAYLLDWVNLLLRWAHVITAIAWIGSSFYFVLLDNSLTAPTDAELKQKGVDGEMWAVHGGGFYHSNKYMVAPKWRALPDNLHWSYWESYSTWLTGFALFTVLYLFNAGTFLVDKTVYDWSPGTAIAAALCFYVVFWLGYDGICRAFGQMKNGDLIVGIGVFLFVIIASWVACRFFAGRAAFLLVGSMIATTMSANVFFWIIPGQRKVVAQLRAGEAPDPIHGRRGKQRSVHNTYFTLPVLVSMLSNHRAGAADARRCADPPQLRRAAQGARAGQANAMGARGGRHPGDRRARVLARAAAAVGRGEGRRGATDQLRRCQGRHRPALHDVPQRAAAEQERRATHAGTAQAARAAGLPAGIGAQADAAEQRDADHRRRASADQALVRRRLAGELSRAHLATIACAQRLKGRQR
jgi:hypothetical protein